MSRRNLRAEMPTVTVWIDDLRAAFGADEINAQIRGGLQGAQTFHAIENGIEVGTRYVPRGTEISLSQIYVVRPEGKK